MRKNTKSSCTVMLDNATNSFWNVLSFFCYHSRRSGEVFSSAVEYSNETGGKSWNTKARNYSPSLGMGGSNPHGRNLCPKLTYYASFWRKIKYLQLVRERFAIFAYQLPHLVYPLTLVQARGQGGGQRDWPSELRRPWVKFCSEVIWDIRFSNSIIVNQ